MQHRGRGGVPSLEEPAGQPAHPLYVLLQQFIEERGLADPRLADQRASFPAKHLLQQVEPGLVQGTGQHNPVPDLSIDRQRFRRGGHQVHLVVGDHRLESREFGRTEVAVQQKPVGRRVRRQYQDELGKVGGYNLRTTARVDSFERGVSRAHRLHDAGSVGFAAPLHVVAHDRAQAASQHLAVVHLAGRVLHQRMASEACNDEAWLSHRYTDRPNVLSGPATGRMASEPSGARLLQCRSTGEGSWIDGLGER